MKALQQANFIYIEHMLTFFERLFLYIIKQKFTCIKPYLISTSNNLKSVKSGGNGTGILS
jgi:hypothetical protein